MRLKELREEKYITQKEVAAVIHCTKGTYSRYEREEREPGIDVLCELADYYGVTIDYLVGRTDTKA